MIDFNDPSLYQLVPNAVQQVVQDWIARRIKPRKDANYRHTSYGLKHILQNETGVYLYNGQFKGAMLAAGYEPINSEEVNWSYYIGNVS